MPEAHRVCLHNRSAWQPENQAYGGIPAQRNHSFLFQQHQFSVAPSLRQQSKTTYYQLNLFVMTRKKK
jgi:hypothetical protein